MFDSRTKPMIAQMQDAGKRARAANAAAGKAGKALYCVPAADRKRGLDSDQIIGLLGQVPETDRRTLSLADAWRRALAHRYPC